MSVTSPPSGVRHVIVYGGDHSPWVQSLLLGLHERGIDHTNVTVPPLSVFLDSGILMPAAKIDDEPWRLDSEQILVRLGFSEVGSEDRAALRGVFAGALERTDDAWAFWSRWSRLRDGHPSAVRRHWNQFWRTFSVFYFFALITLARRRLAPGAAAASRRGLGHFDGRLAAGDPFLGGTAPDTVDLQLFGLVQMFASVPGRSLATLQKDPELPHLRGWIERMQARFSGYAHLYTASHFEPRLPEMGPAPLSERACYWLGCGGVWLAFPISLGLALFLVRRVRAKGLVPDASAGAPRSPDATERVTP